MTRSRWRFEGSPCAAYREDGALCGAPAAWYDDGPGVVLCEAHARASGIKTTVAQEGVFLPSLERLEAERLVDGWLSSYRSPAPDVPARAREDLIALIAGALARRR